MSLSFGLDNCCDNKLEHARLAAIFILPYFQDTDNNQLNAEPTDQPGRNGQTRHYCAW